MLAIVIGIVFTATRCLPAETISPAQPVLVYQVVDAETEQILYVMEGWTEPTGDNADQTAAMTKIIFPQGPVLQQWAIFAEADPPRLLSWGTGIRDGSGEEVASSYARVRQEAFPFLTRTLPPNTYPPEAPLGYVLSNLGLGRRRERAKVNLILMGSSVVELEVWTDGRERVEVPAGTFDAYRVRMHTTAESLFPNLPGFVRQFASFFIPTQTLWLTSEEPQRLIKFTGQMGPPGSPTLLIRLTAVTNR